MIHCTRFADIAAVPNKAGKVFCNAGGWDVYQTGDDIPEVVSEPYYPVLNKVALELRLLQAGILDSMNAFIATQTPEIQIWYRGNEFVRHNPMVIQVAAAAGLTAGEVDAMWLS